MGDNTFWPWSKDQLSYNMNMELSCPSLECHTLTHCSLLLFWLLILVYIFCMISFYREKKKKD